MPGKQKFKPMYTDEFEFFEKWLAPNYRRSITTGCVWCPLWWDHPEARTRVRAMWEAWEIYRFEKPVGGLAAWFTDVADPMMRVLLDPNAVFKGCTAMTHYARSGPDLGLPFVSSGTEIAEKMAENRARLQQKTAPEPHIYFSTKN
ncbi:MULTISPECIES: DUF4913 domain-containing protein [Actinotignum]|uniref:DUF4913 domain-containing protein n=1 Tax=Actinotignum schaalii FB123-CNA-2 TaxID=883067 RepID=S2VIG3_9ACTO|nr:MULTISPECIES: DUF4913 domain-containing protein [Actinotignum]EPD27243.1 hypothetical protein HMPREF9237_00600 [Actinotignum schaalii FB123-CNA-2]MDE1576996.1 DUF4913 domain-containing protein [Actinotignum sanguinis]MDE1653910.1 DUF4913 domain-containing protein [Actinotignum schaalii]MDY5137765.1 DUF4913 domain-containing protein [Actinotignum timonense]MDY5144990.1 DUF4913 domain-containing protein [Actinotignum timonense]